MTNTPCSPYAYVHLNLTALKRPVRNYLKLAVVDAADATPELLSLVWTTSKQGVVRRKWRQRLADNTWATASETLMQRLLDVSPAVMLVPLNGDTMDCRRANIRILDAQGEDVRRCVGEVVGKLPDYARTFQDQHTNKDALIAGLSRFKRRRLTNAQVLQVLNAAIQTDGLLYKETERNVAGYIETLFGVKVDRSQVHAMLNGTSLRVHGFDYAALRATRPTKRARALELWEARKST